MMLICAYVYDDAYDCWYISMQHMLVRVHVYVDVHVHVYVGTSIC